jgi:hypothetical protein
MECTQTQDKQQANGWKSFARTSDRTTGLPGNRATGQPMAGLPMCRNETIFDFVSLIENDFISMRILILIFLFSASVLALCQAVSLHEKNLVDALRSKHSKFLRKVGNPQSEKNDLPSSSDSNFVLTNTYATRGCDNGDGKQLFESMSTKSGFCIDSSSITSIKWTCDSGELFLSIGSVILLLTFIISYSPCGRIQRHWLS